MTVENGDLRMTRAAQRASTVEHATVEIRQAILDGRMAPGTVASIAVLGQQLGISAIPVREALRALAAEGLIVLRPNRRAVVAPISLEELVDVFRAREIYEAELAVLSVTNYSAEDLRGLEDLADAVADETAWDARVELHHEFHELLVAPAASDLDWRLLRIIWGTSDRYFRFNLRALSEFDLRAAHLPLLEAAQAQSAADMRKAFKGHLDEGLEVLSRALAEAAAGR